MTGPDINPARPARIVSDLTLRLYSLLSLFRI